MSEPKKGIPEFHLANFTVAVNREMQEGEFSKPEHVPMITDACVRMTVKVLGDLLNKCNSKQWEEQMRLWLEDCLDYHKYALQQGEITDKGGEAGGN
jgi:hypothetical protein